MGYNESKEKCKKNSSLKPLVRRENGCFAFYKKVYQIIVQCLISKTGVFFVIKRGMNVFRISELCSPLIYLILEVCVMCYFHHLSCSVCFLNISFNKKIKRYCRQEVIYEASTYNLTNTKNNNCII